MPKRLYLYIFREVAEAFAVAFLIYTFVMVIGVMFKPLQEGLGVMFVLRIMPYGLPATWTWTVPVSMLTACTVAYGRLSSENETQAMRSLGVHPVHIFAPALILAILVTIPTVYSNHYIEPRTHELRISASKDALLERPFMVLSLDDPVLHLSGIDIWVGNVQDNELTFLKIHRGVDVRHDDGSVTREIQVIEAAKGTYEIIGERADRELHLTLSDCTFKYLEPAEDFGYTPVGTSTTSLKFSLGDKVFRAGWKDMTTPELERQLARYTGADAEPISKDDLNELRTRIRLRWSAPINSIAFALLGPALGMIMKKGRKLIGFGISVLIVVVVYYPLEVLGRAMSNNAVYPAPLWPYVSLIVITLIAGILLRQIFRT